MAPHLRTPSAYAFDVFISHAGHRADKPFAKVLRDVLKAGWGMEVFLDETDLRHGTSPQQRMQKAMEESQVALLLFSNDFFRRDATRWELEFLLTHHAEHRVQLLPVFLRMTVAEAKLELASVRGAGEWHACLRSCNCWSGSVFSM